MAVPSTFDAAAAIVDCLDTLGISHGYASRYFKSVPGSTHGYGVADPTQLNPEIGDHDTCDGWVNTIRACGMGHITDLAPRVRLGRHAHSRSRIGATLL